MLSSLTKKVFRCPQCHQKLRVPIKPGKTLRVTCNKCKVQFDVAFKSPLFELLQWEKGRTLKYNLEGLKLRFKAMPPMQKLSAFFTIIVVLLFINLLIVGVSILINGPSVKKELPLPEDNTHYEVI